MSAPPMPPGALPGPARAPRIYLAGPTVFAPDAQALFAQLERICARHGAVGLRPSDGEAPEAGSPEAGASEAGAAEAQAAGPGAAGTLAQRIFEGNVALIREADAVIACASPFRGLEPDSGTMWEIGFACALGKPVAVYGLPPGTHEQRIEQACGVERIDGRVFDRVHGQMVESFGLPLNLMIALSCDVAPDAEAALRAALRRLGACGARDGTDRTYRPVGRRRGSESAFEPVAREIARR